MIAIKKLSTNDEQSFKKFLETPRKKLPELKLAHLAKPHVDILVSNFKINASEGIGDLKINTFGGFHCISRDNLVIKDGIGYLFSGYCFYKSEMLIGQEEVLNKLYTSDLNSLYGEYVFCKISQNRVNFSFDFFGMQPLFYYYDEDKNFAASNNYHLLLKIVCANVKGVRLNIRHCRVNILTSGFTYGTPFSRKLDVQNFFMNMATEEISYTKKEGIKIEKTELWDILHKHEDWDGQKYKEYIYKAKEELYELCLAAFKKENFQKIVIDVSGGFDSRAVFATANNLPDIYKEKLYTHTRKSGTKDDVEKASILTNIFNYKKHAYSKVDQTKLVIDDNNLINLDHISRTLGTYSVCSHLYTADYYDLKTLELTGYLGEVVLGYKRCRGEIDYSLGDRRLLRRLGGCYLHNEVEQLKEVFKDQEEFIFEMLKQYEDCDCLFKKNHLLYIDSRNRFICNSSHNIENNNLRIPMLFSKYALKAKWMYFNQFPNNEIPPEKVSMDLIDSINPIIGALPFAESNNDVIAPNEILLNHSSIKIVPNAEYNGPPATNSPNLYKDQVISYMDNLDNVEQMILHIYDYSPDFKDVCLGLYTVVRKFSENLEDLKTTHGRETIRKIYDIYFQMVETEKSSKKFSLFRFL